MSAIINFGINLEKLDKSKIVKNAKGTWANLTLTVNDEISQFNDKASIYVQQTLEERDAKTPRNYVGNGSVVWTNGSIEAVPKEGKPAPVAAQAEDNGLDLPF